MPIMQEILKKVIDHLEREEVYANPDLRLGHLAEFLGIPSHHISQSINKVAKTNFFDLVNRQRIQALKENMNKERYKNFTFAAIASEHGFKSPSSFYRIFKKYTGHTPKQYLNQVKNKPK